MKNSIEDKIGYRIQGQYIVYGLSANGDVSFDYRDVHAFDATSDIHRKQFRAYRRQKKEEGKPLDAVAPNRLADELIVVFGPEISASAAVVALKKLIKEIRKDGLLIGCGRRSENVMLFEKIKGNTVPIFY